MMNRLGELAEEFVGGSLEACGRLGEAFAVWAR